MQLVNGTRMSAEYSVALEPSGRELLVVVIKGTFSIPKEGEPIDLLLEQVPLAAADSFTGPPGMSAPLIEADFAPRKRRCDVLLQGSAHAPEGRPTTRVSVGIRVGKWGKRLAVVGARVWQASLTSIKPSLPQPFVTHPISYDFAFGGVDDRHEDVARHAWYLRNPVGRGYHKHLKREWVDGAALPNTEELDRPVTTPDGQYAPMALGPIGRHWEPRFRYAGTYDERWLDEVFPFLPSDFDDRYYQAGPEDQQLPQAAEGAPVELLNLTPDGRRAFELPCYQSTIAIVPKRGARETYTPEVDTIFFEPDLDRFTMSWRVARPLRRDIFEIAEVRVGRSAPRVPGIAVVPDTIREATNV